MVALLNIPATSAESLLRGRMLSVHLVMELVAIVVAFLVVAVSLHSLDRDKDGTARFTACGFLVVALVDAMHTLTYNGMPAFITEGSTPRAIFFWLAGRTAEVGTLGAIAFGLAPRMRRATALFAGLGIACLVIWVGSYHLEAVPTTFVAGQGVTPFKAAYEFFLLSANMVIALRFHFLARRTGEARLNLLALSCFVMGIGELAFASYKAPSDIQNVFGHIYKVVAYGLMYASTFVTNIRSPYEALRDSEARLREAEHRVGTLGDNLPNTILFHYLIEADGETLHSAQFSGALMQMHGLKPDEIAKNPNMLTERAIPEDRPLLLSGRKRAMQSMQPTEAVVRFKMADGRVRQMLVLWAPRSAEGGLVAMDGSATDITDRVDAEKAKSALQAQLQESQKMEALGTLSSGIAHDFNNVLGAIIGNASLAQDAHRNGAEAEFQLSMGHVQRAATRARDLIKQILTFGRRQTLTKKTQLLRPIVEEALSLLRVSLPAGVGLQSELGDSQCPVFADATQMQQVILNLCTNAWQAIGTEGGHILVRLTSEHLSSERAARHDLRPGNYAVVQVRDNGSGMTETTRRRIFEPFFTTRSDSSGTGLGLAVVHGIVHSHDGVILVESTVGVGTTFRVLIPEAEPPGESTGSAAYQSSSLESVVGLRVLYIDDDEVMRTLVGRLLERDGCHVVLEESPRSAVQAFLSAPDTYDVVVSDFNMPGQSGLDVLRALLAARPGLPTILTSGDVSPELECRAKQLGVVKVLEKQFTLEHLGPTIAEAVSAVRRGQTNIAAARPRASDALPSTTSL
jgi:PAS domain S-box-containing protein